MAGTQRAVWRRDYLHRRGHHAPVDDKQLRGRRYRTIYEVSIPGTDQLATAELAVEAPPNVVLPGKFSDVVVFDCRGTLRLETELYGSPTPKLLNVYWTVYTIDVDSRRQEKIDNGNDGLLNSVLKEWTKAD